MKTIFKNIKELILAEENPASIVRGLEMKHLPVLKDAFLEIEDDRIISFGNMSQCPEAEQIIDCTNCFLLPTWCDSHTHLVFAASRHEEFVMRIKGKSYEEIAEAGGGILNSAKRLQQTSEEDLFKSAQQRLREVIRLGTGAIEVKSGYGLTVDAELKMLRVIQRLKAISPIPIKSTFLGAHAVPVEYQSNRPGYINLIIEKMLPQIAVEGLADYCDVFCDKGFFTVEETDQILKAASKYGLKPKIHANELGITGGVQVGVANNAVSVDHLECTGPEEIETLKNSNTIPTLLPGTSYFLNIPYGNARVMMDANLPVCLASDYNPGSTPSGNIPFLLSLACTKMNMLPEEAIHAVIKNGAAAMELNDQVGSITPGKRANFIVTKSMDSLAQIPYYYGSNLIDQVWINGKLIEN